VLLLCARPAPLRRRRALEARGVDVVELPARGGRIAPATALAALAARGVTSVMVEGGAEVLGSFLEARLVDEVALFRGPLLLGGRASLGAFGGTSPRDPAAGLRMEPVPESEPFPWPWRPRFERWRPRARGALRVGRRS
jgi:riboflavin biosynthesis pyrimidine reductase